MSMLLQQVPHVNRQEYSLLDISEDGFVSTCSTSVCASRAPSEFPARGALPRKRIAYRIVVYGWVCVCSCP